MDGSSKDRWSRSLERVIRHCFLLYETGNSMSLINAYTHTHTYVRHPWLHFRATTFARCGRWFSQYNSVSLIIGLFTAFHHTNFFDCKSTTTYRNLYFYAVICIFMLTLRKMVKRLVWRWTKQLLKLPKTFESMKCRHLLINSIIIRW